MAKIGAVINKKGGTLPPEEAGQLLDEIRRDLEKRVSPGCLAMVSGEGIGKEIERITDQGIDILVIGGGDGTISAAARVAAGKDITLAVLPLGTRNHFARDLGIPSDPLEALGLLDSMNVQQIDLGEVNGHAFINNATLGLYPKIVRERDKKTRKSGWRKWPAHVVASLMILWRLPRMRLKAEVDDDRISALTPFLFVGNNEYRGESIADISRPSLTGGRLWFSMARASGFWALFRMTRQISIRGLEGVENLETRNAGSVTVHSRRKKVTAAIDGEILRFASPLRFRIRKKSLRVLVP